METGTSVPESETAVVVLATAASPGAAPTLAEESWRSGSVLRGLVARLAELDHVVVVVRAEEHAGLVDGVGNVVVVVDPEWEEGAAASLRAGLDFLTHSTAAAVAFVVPVSAPEVDPSVLQTLLAAQHRAETPVVVPKYRYVRGGPVLLERGIWPRFLGAEGALDIEELLLAHPQWVTEVRVDVAPPRPLATVADLAELAR